MIQGENNGESPSSSKPRNLEITANRLGFNLATGMKGSGKSYSAKLLLGIRMSALPIIAPDIISSNPGPVTLTIVAFLSHPLLLMGVAFVLALVFKKGCVALFGSVLSYFGILMFTVNLAYMWAVMGSVYSTRHLLFLCHLELC
jgi:hypothetical protein